MKRSVFVSLCLLSVLSVVFGTLFIISETKMTAHKKMIYERAYTQANEACENLALSLFAANKSFLASDISAVGERASLLSLKLSELSLDGVRCAELYRYLSLVNEISAAALQVIDAGESGEYYKNLFGLFAPYAKRVEDEFLPTLDYGALDKIFADLGGIYYDGVYSDEDRGELFSLLKSAPVIEEDEITHTVERLLGKNAKLKSSLVGSFPPFYSFYCGNASVDISQMGGYVLRFLYDRRPALAPCSAEEARGVMDEFLKELGFTELELVEFLQRDDFFAVFSPVVTSDAGEILCLSERIKVCVGRDSGKVISYDALDYYKYHKKAREADPLQLPDGAKLVYIIASSGREELCYESGGEYFDVSSGQRKIKIY